MRRITTGAGVLMAFALIAGCTSSAGDDERPEDAESPGQSGAPAAPDDESEQAEPITVTRELLGIDIEVSVHPVEVEGDLAALTVDYAVSEDQTDEFGSRINNLGAVLDSTTRVDIQATGLRLVDTGAGEVYPVATDADGDWTSRYDVDQEASGFAARSASLHAAPEADVVDLMIPSLGTVLDVPVVEAGEQLAAAQETLAAPADPTGYELRTYAVSHDELTSVEAEGDEVTVTLTSDVLFGPDEHELSGEADEALRSAADEITSSAAGGEVHVVGHTDDVPTQAAENNHVLSERRADAVAARLDELLDGDYTFITEGRGEDDPRASNRSDEGRAANRRVEIHFDGTLVREAESGELPETDAVEGPGTEPLEYEGWRVEVESMIRRDGGLVGTLRFDVAEDDHMPFHLAVTPEPRDEHSNQGRGFGSLSQVISMHGVSMVTSEERLFPYDYELREGEETVVEDAVRRRLLGDEILAWYPDEDGQGLLATAVWPDTGQDEVTLELPGRFRLVDVPVTDGEG